MTGDDDDEGTYLPQSSPAQIAQIATLYPDDPTQGSPFDTGLANQLTPQFKRLAAFQGDYLFTGTCRFLLEHASKTQNTWSWCAWSFYYSLHQLSTENILAPLNKRGESTPVVGTYHTSDLPLWCPAENSTDFASPDALINFINTLDPTHSASSTKTKASQAVFWPKWNTPTSNGSPSLLTLSESGLINVTSKNFRVDATKYLLDLLLRKP
ncbi:hypothetical protein B0H16DRAFT_1791683 [Mycena metata]|uniref:Carboxylesterase type B domain-containing protein n=1 Tax=Mycena metata TaxID=1033252 RepID=A0AAD7HI70_9AGAR|nr:hypothetical protein B0H16DRAFT_1791683 [Mycena metata]